ncbi:hypothetical protein C7N43_09425 [Sphingobacteriales bacterium UPWRP_1]|nr:hypothetical protein B6N25_06830 [Sphingobacteriales bacterium TSM_CSS]PSJ77257.1 hypothetical protein C7N43_09425 [Sphingobacteriales bacterium UPWRP_1]
MPSGLVMTRFVPVAATATKRPLPYVTESHWVACAAVRAVQVMPSGLVMTGFVPIPSPTATKRPLPYATEYQELAAAAVRGVQVMPSGLVMTRFVPLSDTATKRPLPYVTEFQEFASAAVRAVQVAPWGQGGGTDVANRKLVNCNSNSIRAILLAVCFSVNFNMVEKNLDY